MLDGNGCKETEYLMLPSQPPGGANGKRYTHSLKKDKRLSLWFKLQFEMIGIQRLLFWTAIFKPRKQECSANFNIKTLDDNLYSMWESGLQIMEDNAPIHLVKKIKTWFENNVISGIIIIIIIFKFIFRVKSSSSWRTPNLERALVADSYQPNFFWGLFLFLAPSRLLAYIV